MADEATQAAGREIRHPLLKLLIGSFGGLIAALGPKFLTGLAATATHASALPDATALWVNGFYLLIYALLVGTVIMIQEWQVPSPPWSTLQKALVVPALVASLLGSAGEAATKHELLDRVEEQTKAIRQQQQGVPVLEGLALPPQGALEPRADKLVGWLFGEGTAYAADAPLTVEACLVRPQASFNSVLNNLSSAPTTQAGQAAKYAIVLDRRAASAEATKRADELSRKISGRTLAILFKGAYLVVKCGPLKTETDARLEIASLQSAPYAAELNLALLPVN